jgi:hypothetical protein
MPGGGLDQSLTQHRDVAEAWEPTGAICAYQTRAGGTQRFDVEQKRLNESVSLVASNTSFRRIPMGTVSCEAMNEILLQETRPVATRSNLPSDQEMQRNRSLYCSDPNCTSCKELRQEYDKMKQDRPPTVFRLRTAVPRRIDYR